jgi:hypothetical protein
MNLEVLNEDFIHLLFIAFGSVMYIALCVNAYSNRTDLFNYVNVQELYEVENVKQCYQFYYIDIPL